MKATPRLIRFLRALFGFLRGCAILFLIGYAFQFFMSPYMPKRSHQWEVANVEFAADSVPIKIKQDEQPAASVVMRTLSGRLQIVEDAVSEGTFANIARTSIFAAKFVHIAFLITVFHLLWRLFQNLEQRQIFSDGNLVLVRGLGTALVSYSVIALVVDLWKGWRIGRYIADHLTFEGAQAFTLSPTTDTTAKIFDALLHYSRFDVTMFVTGLGVLVLAEVFRQGLLLQKESDLTV
jgi:hypothetical protein